LTSLVLLFLFRLNSSEGFCCPFFLSPFFHSISFDFRSFCLSLTSFSGFFLVFLLSFPSVFSRLKRHQKGLRTSRFEFKQSMKRDDVMKSVSWNHDDLQSFSWREGANIESSRRWRVLSFLFHEKVTYERDNQSKRKVQHRRLWWWPLLPSFTASSTNEHPLM